MQDEATDLLQQAVRIPLCCVAAETLSVLSAELTKELHAQMHSGAGVVFSVNCLGKSPKEGENVVNSHNHSLKHNLKATYISH